MFFKALKIGADYMEKFPLEPLLNPIFKEVRVKKVMLKGNLIIPPFIVFIIFWSLYIGGVFKGVPVWFALTENISVTLVSIVFLLLLPIQGYIWFYYNSQKTLSKSLKSFYEKHCKSLNYETKVNPNMCDLIDLINLKIKKEGNEFLKEL